MTASPWWNGDMAVLFVIVLILVIGAAVMAASGRLGQYPPAQRDFRPDQGFDVVLRGYRMDEVDARIAALEEQVDELRGRTAPQP